MPSDRSDALRAITDVDDLVEAWEASRQLWQPSPPDPPPDGYTEVDGTSPARDEDRF